MPQHDSRGKETWCHRHTEEMVTDIDEINKNKADDRVIYTGDSKVVYLTAEGGKLSW